MNTFGNRGTTELHRFPSPKSDPWIFYSHGERSHTLYSLSEREVHNKCLEEMLHTDILCSMHGWLVLSDQNDRQILRLLNPVSMATIQLPLFSRTCFYDLGARSSDLGALSCDPDNPDCIVMLVKYSFRRSTFYFCRPSDNVWSELDLELEFEEYIRAVGCYKGQICIFTFFERIFLVDANPPYPTFTNMGFDKFDPPDPGHHGKREEYLVESDGELFVIYKYGLREDAYNFVVSKLDVTGKSKRFVAVDDLGDRAFFLSSYSSGISCYVEKCYGIKANTIYFTHPFDPRIFSFDLQNKVITFSFPCPNVKEKLVRAEWILPLSLNGPCKFDRKVDIIAPFQIKKSTLEQSSISKSDGKDCFGLPDATTKSVAKKFFSRSGRDWSELPHDMLISIAKKLSSVSCACAATVCKSWRSVITWAPKKLLGCPIFLHMASSSNEAFHFISNGRYNVPILENSEGLSIQDAKYGWLLMTSCGGKNIFFFNPLTTEKIEIPRLPHHNVRSLCFTSLPTSSNCSILGIYDYMSCYLIYHIRRGQKEWTKVQVEGGYTGGYKHIPYSNPVFHNGIFYWVWSNGNLCAYDPTKVVFLFQPRRPCTYVHMSYLVESEEKLMFVRVERYGERVTVYGLDEASMAWKKVNTLDNKVVFLSRNSSLVIDCLEMPGFEDIIFFDKFIDDNKPIFFSLKTGELGVYDGGHHVIRDFCDIPEYQFTSAWIKPDIKQHHIRELNWYDW